MITAVDLLNRLQTFQRKSAIYQDIFEAEANEINERQAVLTDFNNQQSVDTATWALSIYEDELYMPVDQTKSYEDRRAKIKSKMRGTGTVNVQLIKDVANAFTGGTISVGFSNGTITITFIDIIGTPPRLDDFESAIEEIKPAHLAIQYIYLYNRWEQVTTKTWNEISTFTWDQVLQGDIF